MTSKVDRPILAVVLITLLGSPALFAESILFHVKTALDKDDAQICAVPNVAVAAQESGDQVTLLFDASAVTSITRGWGWLLFGERTPMDAAALPERERRSLYEQFGIPLDGVPKDYGEYLQFLKERGAKIYVNRTMLTLYNIDPKDVDPVAVAADLKTMLGLFKKADRILVY